MLMCSQSSVLRVEVFRWISTFEKIEDYIETCTGCHSALLFPTLFGLRLAEDFEFGTRFSKSHLLHRSLSLFSVD